MDIRQIGLIERIFGPNQGQPLQKTPKIQFEDRVSISSSAMKRLKEANSIQPDERIKELVMNAPDIREDMVRSVKEKIDSGVYFSDIDKEILAEKMLKSPFGIRLGY